MKKLLLIVCLLLPACSEEAFATSNPISNYPQVSTVTGTDQMYDWQGGALGWMTPAQLKSYVIGSGNIAISTNMTLNVTGSVTLTSSTNATVSFGTGGTVLYTSNIGSSVEAYNAQLAALAALGSPGTSGYVLSSTSGGTLSWIAPGGGATTIGSNASGVLSISSGVLNFVNPYDGANGLVVLDASGRLPTGMLGNYIGTTVQTYNANLTSLATTPPYTMGANLSTTGTWPNLTINLTGFSSSVLTAAANATNTNGGFPTIAPVNANLFYAGPTSGSSNTPNFRAIVAGDVPTLNQNTTGNAATATFATSAGTSTNATTASNVALSGVSGLGSGVATAAANATNTNGGFPTIAPVNANLFYAGPTSGSSNTPNFRAIVAGDVPTLNQNTTGNAATATFATSAGTSTNATTASNVALSGVSGLGSGVATAAANALGSTNGLLSASKLTGTNGVTVSTSGTNTTISGVSITLGTNATSAGLTYSGGTLDLSSAPNTSNGLIQAVSGTYGGFSGQAIPIPGTSYPLAANAPVFGSVPAFYLYYPGLTTPLAYSNGSTQAILYYPNGHPLTQYDMSGNLVLSYPNNRVMTDDTGNFLLPGGFGLCDSSSSLGSSGQVLQSTGSEALWTTLFSGTTSQFTDGTGAQQNLSILEPAATVTTSAATSGTVSYSTSSPYADQTIYLSSGSTISSITIARPGSGNTRAGEVLRLVSKSAVSSLSITGGTNQVGTSPSSLSAGGSAAFQALDTSGNYARLY